MHPPFSTSVYAGFFTEDVKTICRTSCEANQRNTASPTIIWNFTSVQIRRDGLTRYKQHRIGTD